MLGSGKKKKQLWSYLMQKHAKDSSALLGNPSSQGTKVVAATYQSKQQEGLNKVASSLLKGCLTSRNGLKSSATATVEEVCRTSRDQLQGGAPVVINPNKKLF